MIIMYIGAIALFVYLVYMVIFGYALKKGENAQSFDKKTVSVVVAARNEEDNIAALLTGLMNQSYPQELLEVIIVNDRSTDRTADIVKQFQSKWNKLRQINIEKTPKNYAPKKYALTQGINNAQAEIVILTDADCIVNKYWVESMVSMYLEDVDIVVGFSRTKIPKWEKAPLSRKFEFFDFLAMFIAAAGAINSGKVFSCSNQNLSYRKSAFLKVGGFEKIKALTSGDDVNLLQLFRKAGFKSRFCLIPHSFVYTKPVKGWASLINQRARWASNSKWQLLLNPEFFIYLVAIFLLNISLLIAIVINIPWLVGLFAGKLIGEYIFLSSHFSTFENDRRRLKFIVIWSAIQPFYILVVTLLGLFDIFAWKKN